MSGPGDVIAGLAPPLDNAPASAPWPDGPADAAAAGDARAEAYAEGALSRLAGYIRNSWSRNKRARDLVEERLLACLRARRGVYAQAELPEMWTADAGEPIYLPLAATKMRAAESALRDLLLPDGERPWGLDPSPLPELPPEVAGQIEQQAAASARQEMLALMRQQGTVMSLPQMAGVAARLRAQLGDAAEAALRKEAQARAQRMEAQIELRMERGGYYQAVAEFIQQFCTYPAAVLKGPFLRRGKRLSWAREDGVTLSHSILPERPAMDGGAGGGAGDEVSPGMAGVRWGGGSLGSVQDPAYPSPGPSRRGRGTNEPGDGGMESGSVPDPAYPGGAPFDADQGRPWRGGAAAGAPGLAVPGQAFGSAGHDIESCPPRGASPSLKGSGTNERAPGFVPRVVAEPELVWVAVNPFDCYPAPEAESCQDGDFIERIRMTRADLYECIGCPGYSEAAIRRVLASQQSGALRAWLWSDAERRALEGETHDVWIPDYLVDALHFWGSVEGRVLREHGITQGIHDELAYYEVDAVLIGDEVIRCEVNDDPLGRRPYYNASYDPVPGAFWGNSIFELMRDCQAMVNACARALNANLGLASGPIMGIDVSQLAAGQDPKALRPLQVIQLDRSRAQAAAAPIEWYQADSRASELLSIIATFEQKADDLSGIPRYLYGDEKTQGGAATASGLSMLMGSAAKGLRRAVASIDRGVIARTVEAAYVHEMLYSADESIKGDCTVSARGAAAVLVKEHLQQTRTQFLAMTANPIDMQIIGASGRRAVLKEVVKTLDMPVEEIVGSDQDWQRRQAQPAAPPQPTPNARLKSDTELKREHMRSATRLAEKEIVHPAAAAAVLDAATRGGANAPANGALPAAGGAAPAA